VGKEVVFGLKAVSAKGRDAGWSNLVTLQVIPPLAVPAQLRPEAVPAGVRLTWTGHAPGWRVFRLAAGEKDYSLAAEPTAPEWTDTATQYGTTYRYRVQAVAKSGTAEAQSELSPEVEITPRDIFPPAVPAGLTAITGTNSIELAWERNTEPDLAGYRIYRSSGGAFEKVGESAEAPSFSDRKVEAGKTYRYAVSAFDKNGNESKRSEEVGAVAP
jgi:fibronectin type 3 domain-containing protein